MLKSGDVIGDYKILKELGVGGMGTVYKAEGPNGNLVALKMLHQEMLENKRVVQKFFNEAMILAKLEHEHITKLMEFFPDGDNFAIVMEYVVGDTLKDLIAEAKGVVPYKQALSLASQINDAFHFAHEQGIIHRDIKPANIMVPEGKIVKVMDFGIAKITSSASRGTSKWGTLHYTAPERFKDDTKVDLRSDIYSIGIMFYELFCGRKPFESDDDARIMYCHFNEDPDPPKDVVKGVSENVSNAILKSLAKNPDDRFNNCAEFNAAMFGEAAVAVPSSSIGSDATVPVMKTVIKPPVIEGESIWKKKAVMVPLVLVLLLAVIGGGYFMFAGNAGEIVTQADTGTEETSAAAAEEAAPSVAKKEAAPAAVATAAQQKEMGEFYAKKAEEFYNDNDPFEALKYADMALKSDSKNVAALNLKGAIYFDRKNTDQALKFFNEVIAIDPGNEGAQEWIEYIESE